MPAVEETLEFDEIRKMLAQEAVSKLSKRAALTLMPSHRPEEIQHMLEETDEAFICLQKEIASPLGETHDIYPALEKANKKIVLAPKEFNDLAATLETCQKMKEYFGGERHLVYPLLEESVSMMESEDILIRRIRQTFDDHGEVSDNASPKLYSIRSQMDTVKGRIRKAFQKILQNKEQAPYFRDAIVTQRDGRYVIPIKEEYRNKFPGIVHDRSSTGETVFMEPLFSVALNNDLEELRIEERQEIHEILRRLTEIVAEHEDSIKMNCEKATHLELVFAKGALAEKMHAVRAEPSPKGILDLRKARHPLIPANKVVPVSFTLHRDFDILIITGSNAGGKTISLKTAGLLSLMNQSGLFIPAAEGSKLPVYRNIYAIIGDDQSIEYNLSTFSSYITQLVHVLRHAAKDDLVLLDELGSGTDPVEGAAIAVSVTKSLYAQHIPCIISSHFSEMKKLAYDEKGIENAFVEFDEETLKPTYHLIIGVAGNSNAISLCRRLGMPESILHDAENLKEASPFYHMESVMEQLNGQMRQVEAEKQLLDQELAEAESLHKDLKEAAGEFYDKRDDILNKAREEAQNMKRDLRVQSENIIKDLKKKAAHLDNNALLGQISKTRQSINGIRIPYGASKQGKEPLPQEELKPGRYVYIDTFDKSGHIVSVSGNKITVLCGPLKVTVSPGHVFDAKEPVKTEPEKKTYHFVSASKSASAVPTTLNIIGKTVNEAIPEVDRFLNDCFMAHVSPVQIVHGKGTGALKRGIRDYLQTLPFVTSFKDAAPSNGGSGVTEVYF